MEVQSVQYENNIIKSNQLLGYDLKPNANKNPDLNISQLHPQQQQSIAGNKITQNSEPSIMKQLHPQNNNHLLEISNSKSKGEVNSGYSFSKFEAISDENQQVEGVHTGKFQSELTGTGFRKQSANKVLTSTKVISSNKLIEEPIQVKTFDQNGSQGKAEQKHVYNFQFNYLTEADLFEKFIKFAMEKGMDFKIGQNIITVTKKVPFFKSILGLCLPASSGFQHEIYQLACISQNTAKLTQSSGVIDVFMKVDSNYYQFRQQFLVQLWAHKYLICGSLHENLRHFIRFANSMKCDKKDQTGNKLGQVDNLKKEIQKTIKKMSKEYQQGEKKKKVPEQTKSKQKQDHFERLNSSELREVKSRIKQMEETLKMLLEKEMKKEQCLKKRRKGSPKKLSFEVEGGALIEMQDSLLQSKIFLTPSIERMLLNIFYLHLDLEEIVKTYVLSHKDIGDFQRKKMIIKGSLSPTDIFRYLELHNFNKSLEPLPAQQQRQQLFPQSIKILSSLRYSTYPSPCQTLEVLSIFKTTLLKQIQSMNRKQSDCRVKVQDDNNEDRTLLQFCIYCLIICDNRDIYPTIETALIFWEGTGMAMEEWVKMGRVLKKGINFIEKEWEL